jgi:hypothetical protein
VHDAVSGCFKSGGEEGEVEPEAGGGGEEEPPVPRGVAVGSEGTVDGGEAEGGVGGGVVFVEADMAARDCAREAELFSGGTVSWFVIFLYASSGAQRPLAMVLFVLSLVGEVVYSAADLFMGGQTWVAVDPRMGTFVLWTFVGMTFAHGAALYAHYIMEPDRIQTIELEVIVDDAEAKALDLTKQKINAQLHEITDALSAKAVDDVLVRLRLPVASRAGGPLVLDSTARDVDDVVPVAPVPAVVPAAPVPAVVPAAPVPAAVPFWPGGGLNWSWLLNQRAGKPASDAGFRDETPKD